MSNGSAEHRARRRVATILGIAAGLIAAGTAAQEPAPESAEDRLDVFGARATIGAAPGYVEDRVCANCHRSLYDSFQEVGMAQAFKAPARARLIERFGEEYFHEATGRYYRIDRHDDGRLTFTRFQRDAANRPVNELEIAIDWVLGSGNRARSYLYQTPHGEIFMLPLSWYSEAGQWRMSPGFEHFGHQGVGRKVTRACLFCHNAYPEVPAGSDAFWQPQTFPQSLPEGIGCQRCHGPGAAHVRTVLSGGSLEDVHQAITNPAKLPDRHRDSVCFQCHLLPAESVEGVRIVGRHDYSFRPGELLTDYIANVDIRSRDAGTAERFEINHHAYRLTRSACYRESGGELTCISCHDPHEKPASEAFRRSSSEVCRDCHTDPAAAHPAGISAAGNCIDCHMPTRRTNDVIEVTMTDHRIARGPFDLEAIVQAVEKTPVLVEDVDLLGFGDPPAGEQRELYPRMAALRANRLVDSARQGLERHLRDHRYDDPAPYVDLAKAQITLGDLRAAERTARQLIDADGNMAIAYSLLGTSLLGQGRTTSAAAALQRAIELEPDPEAHFNLAAAHLTRGDVEAADRAIDAALELRPLMAIAWKYRGLIRRAQNEASAAEAALLRALSIEPGDSSVYAELVTLLREQGKREEAERYLEVGLRVSGNPAALRGLSE